MRFKRLLRASLALFGLIACFQVAGVQSAAAAAGPASCAGHEASSISPPGSSEEVPGGMPALTAEVRALAAQLGISPGQIISFVASLHEGSHEACDAALE
jgi:hypothetical protein